MDAEIPVLCGYLNVPTQSGFPLNKISKKKSCSRYCLLFNPSRHGIERLELFESKDDKNPKIVTLENCVKITQESTNIIQIVKKTETITLSALNEDDLKEWVHALQTVAFRDKSGPIMEEDNDLYCSSFDGLFMVTLIPSETSIRCNLDPKTYMLYLTATELQLKSTNDLNIVSKWPYRYIRKYGYRDGKFTFEAGRKCSTGEGVFTLDHSNPQEIFRSMSTKMKSMKKLISGESFNADNVENQLSAAASMEAGSRSPLPPSPLNQPSSEFEINSSHSLSLQSCHPSNESNSFNNISQSAAISAFNTNKYAPHKPPRKLPCTEKLNPNIHSTVGVPISEKGKKYQNYEPVSITSSVDPNKIVCSSVILKPSSPEVFRKTHSPPELPVRNESKSGLNETVERDYECIENITEAWKTLGLNEIKHTERSVIRENEDLDISRLRLQNRDKIILIDSVLTSKSHKIVDIDIGENISKTTDLSPTADYDRLNFLSPNNKSSGGYKTIVAVTSQVNRIEDSTVPLNEYEIIASPDIQMSRKADDAHLGYGIVRKSNVTRTPVNLKIGNITTNPSSLKGSRVKNLSEGPIDHQTYNGINYTIVSKPKRV